LSNIKYDPRDPRPKPAIDKWLNVFYDALAKESKRRKIDGKMVLVYEGYFSRLFRAVVNNPKYYTPIRTILTSGEDPSITILQTGNAHAPSIVVLNHRPPAQESWPEDLTGVPKSATLWVELDRRLSAVESWRETTGGTNFTDILRNFEGRISKLERQLAKLAKE